ncbi:cyclase family protein [Myxococcota bacterium]|nr:cyclase family protein [Myxococcota bacterium]
MQTLRPYLGLAEPTRLNDQLFDVEAVESGSWVPGPYGPEDELGSYNEVTPEKTARALSLLNVSRPVRTYTLSETLFNGFPAFGTREYDQKLVVLGYRPPGDFEGVFQGVEPLGPNRQSVHEERVTTSYNLGTKINGLHHTGVGNTFYNGFLGSEIARSWGTAKLGNEKTFPIVTRGILIDVLALVMSQGRDNDTFTAPNGNPSLRSNYRITVEDIEACLDRQGIVEEIGPGDVVLFRTGWSNLIRDDPERYLMGWPPGPYLRELRYLAQKRPAIIGNDTWCFECLDPEITSGAGTPGHQLLFMRYGIRIGEAVRTQELADDGIYEFVFCHTPQPAEGATAGAAPCMALAQPPA